MQYLNENCTKTIFWQSVQEYKKSNKKNRKIFKQKFSSKISFSSNYRISQKNSLRHTSWRGKLLLAGSSSALNSAIISMLRFRKLFNACCII